MTDNKEALLGRADEILEGLVSVASVAEGQLPIICEEIVMFGMIANFIGVMGCFTLLGFTWYVFKKHNSWWRADRQWWVIVLIVIGLLSFIGAVVDIQRIFQTIFAPRLFVLEYLKGLL